MILLLKSNCESYRPHPQPLPLRGGEKPPPTPPKEGSWLAHCPTGMTAQLLPSPPLGIPKGDACYRRDARRGGVGGGVSNFNNGILSVESCKTSRIILPMRSQFVKSNTIREIKHNS